MQLGKGYATKTQTIAVTTIATVYMLNPQTNSICITKPGVGTTYGRTSPFGTTGDRTHLVYVVQRTTSSYCCCATALKDFEQL